MFLVRSIGFYRVVIYSFLIICCSVNSKNLQRQASSDLGQPSAVNRDPLFKLERNASSRLWRWIDSSRTPFISSSQIQLISTGLHRRNVRKKLKHILHSVFKQDRVQPKNTPDDKYSFVNHKKYPRSARNNRSHQSIKISHLDYFNAIKNGKDGKPINGETNNLENTMDSNNYNDQRNGKRNIFKDVPDQTGIFYVRRSKLSRTNSTYTQKISRTSATSIATSINSNTVNQKKNDNVSYTATHHWILPLRFNTNTDFQDYLAAISASQLSTIFKHRRQGQKKHNTPIYKRKHRKRRRRSRKQVSKRRPHRLHGKNLDHWVAAADQRHRFRNASRNDTNHTHNNDLFNNPIQISSNKSLILRDYDPKNNETVDRLWNQFNNSHNIVTSNPMSKKSIKAHTYKQDQQNNSTSRETLHTNTILAGGRKSTWILDALHDIASETNINSNVVDVQNDGFNDSTKKDMYQNLLSPKVDTHSKSIFHVSHFNKSSLYPSQTPSVLSILLSRTASSKLYSVSPPSSQLSNRSNLPVSQLSLSASSPSSMLGSSSLRFPPTSSSYYPLYSGHHINSVVPQSDPTNSGILHPIKVTIPHASRKMPQALIIGVKKGGTRAVLEFLRLHPDVRAPGPEPHFFDKHYHNGLEWYRGLMPKSEEGQLTIEKTPSYFITKDVPKRVYQFSKHLKLIVVVRDPVTRVISDYTQVASKRQDSLSFEQMVFVDNTTRIVDTQWSPVRIGVYAKHLKHWLQYFPLEQMHFVSGERLIENPADEMLKVQNFLGLRPIINHKYFYLKSKKGFPCILKPNRQKGSHPHCLGETKGRIHPNIDPSVIRRLRDFYKPFNIKFYRMVNQDFGWV
ncbi:uncharacterized protein LOC115214062 [Argonauta hians]